MDTTAQNNQICKHIMLSYQRHSESLVSKVLDFLKEVQSLPIWMDQHGGVKEYLSSRLIAFIHFKKERFDFHLV